MRGNPGVRLVRLGLGVVVMGITLVLSSGVASAAAPSATGSPTTGLTNGSSVSLSGSGWAANSTLFIVECANKSGQSGCDTGKLKTTQTTGSGSFSATFSAFTGTVGNGTCNAGSTGCFIAVSNGTPAAYVAIPISFAGAPAPTPTSSAPVGSAPTSSAPTGGSGASPVAVAAGSGGTADHHGPNRGLLVLTGVLGVLVIAGTTYAVRLRR